MNYTETNKNKKQQSGMMRMHFWRQSMINIKDIY